MLCLPMEASTKANIFMGDDDSLLEHLLKACQKREIVGEVQQRDLQPFNFDDFETSSSRKPASRVATATKTGKRGNAGSLSTSPSPTPAVSATGSPNRLTNQTRNKAFRNNGVPFKMQTGHAALFNVAASSVKTSSAACPGFFSSPKPEAIPMPTSSFLQRAASVKA